MPALKRQPPHNLHTNTLFYPSQNFPNLVYCVYSLTAIELLAFSNSLFVHYTEHTYTAYMNKWMT